MKALKVLVGLAVAMAMTTGVVMAKEKKADAPKYAEGSCCDKAAKEGKKCEHPCCVAAEKQGKACKKCNKAGKKCE